MAEFWVTKPGEEARLGELDAEAARLRQDLAQIESLSDTAACRICGASAELTEEHAPSKKAGNFGKMIRGVIDEEASLARGVVQWRTHPIQGAKYATLCGPCNNRTGSWYNPAYVRLVNYCKTAARPDNAGRVCRLDIPVHRQRVSKQALTSLVAISQPGLTARYPEIRTLLVGKEDRRPLAPVRLWLYLRANPGGVATGITIAMNIERRSGHLVAGFSFWPLGWIMTIGDVAVEGAANVSDWTELDYHDKAPATVEVPCQWALSVYPGDFRGPDEGAGEAWKATSRV